MIISKNSQLGLMLWDREMLLQYLEDSKKTIKREVEWIDQAISRHEENPDDEGLEVQTNDGDLMFKEIGKRLAYNPELVGSEFYTVRHPKPYLYLIQPTVEKCAAMIRIKDNFSCVVFNKIKDGEHVYLLGKNEFIRFVKFNNAIRGSFWNREKQIAFEIGFLLDDDRYYFPTVYKDEFNRIVRLVTFVAIGDVEIEVIEKSRNNGKTKKAGKITNSSEFNVYVVDSSWNKIIIRTEGFAVRGHFRLQPCGEGFKDRKLIWVDAFEKHGYKRQPKAKIVQ